MSAVIVTYLVNNSHPEPATPCYGRATMKRQTGQKAAKIARGVEGAKETPKSHWNWLCRVMAAPRFRQSHTLRGEHAAYLF